MNKNRRQKAESRRQRAESRGQKADSRQEIEELGNSMNSITQ
jgi:hypothetical protein